MNLTIAETFKLEFSKRELTLVTKALCGKLNPDKGELGEARELGLLLLNQTAERLSEKLQAVDRATQLAEQENGAEGGDQAGV